MGNWHLIFLVYAVTTGISWLWLVGTPIAEHKENHGSHVSNQIWGLLKNTKLILAFSVILLIVGFEIGLMTAVPKYLLERCNMPIEKVDWDVLERITNRILAEVEHVNRVCYDMSPKPPATIEFE